MNSDNKTIRRSFLRKLLLVIPVFSFSKAHSNNIPSANSTTFELTTGEAPPPDKLMEKLEDIDALVSECYSRLQSNGQMFKSISETKTKIQELTQTVDTCNKEVGSPDDIKAVHDDLKAIKEIIGMRF